MRNSTIHAALAALLCTLTVTAPVRAQDDELDLAAGPTGANEPTEDEKKDIEKRRVKTVRPNKVAIDRANGERRAKGEAPLDESLAASDDDELVPAAADSIEPTETLVGATPRHVDNSKHAAFPPIGNQGSLGSCTCWATTYYQYSYETAFARGTNNDTQASGTVFSPKWTYNMINGGANNGSGWGSAYNVLTKHGAATLAQFPYDSNFRAWDLNPAHWQRAISYRATGWQTLAGMNTATGQAALKQVLANGHIVTFATYIRSWKMRSVANDRSTTADDAFVGQKACSWVAGSEGGHMMTIVGYDDTLWVDVNGNGRVDSGEKGCFKVANSWGSGWGNRGFVWVAYDAFNTTSRVAGGPGTGRVQAAWGGYVFTLGARASYRPKLLAKFTVNQLRRKQLSIKLGASPLTANAPTTTWTAGAISNQGGNYAFNGTTTAVDGTFFFDLTDLIPSGTAWQRYYIIMTDSTAGDASTIKAFSLVDPSRGTTVPLAGGLPARADASTRTELLAYDVANGDSAPPVAVIKATLTPGPTGTTVLFDGTGSRDPNGTIVSWTWTFGDDSPAQTGATVTHVYTRAGTYTATLTVKDGLGSTAVATWPVTVTDTTPPTAPLNLVATVRQETPTAKPHGKRPQAAATASVDLAWTASTDDSGSITYTIYRDGAVLGSTSATTFRDASVTAGTSVSYYIVATDPAKNESARSNTATVTP